MLTNTLSSAKISLSKAFERKVVPILFAFRELPYGARQ